MYKVGGIQKMATKLDLIVDKVNSDHKATLITKGLPDMDYDRIPFSSPRSNYQTYGGIPRGKLIEFFGLEGGGKTTSAIDVCVNAQYVFEVEWDDEVSQVRMQE